MSNNSQQQSHFSDSGHFGFVPEMNQTATQVVSNQKTVLSLWEVQIIVDSDQRTLTVEVLF